MTIAIFYFIVVFFSLKFFEKKLGQFNIIFIFSLLHIVYTFMIPFELMLFKELSRFNVIKNADTDLYVYWSFISYVGFIIPFLFLKNNRLSVLNFSSFNPIKISKVKIYFFLFTFIALGFLFFNDLLVEASSYEGNIELSAYPVYKFYIQIGTYFLSYVIFLLMLKKDFINAIIMLIIAFSWSIYSSDKNPLYITSFVFLFCLGSVLKKKLSALYILSFLIVIPIFSVLFSSFRTNNLGNFEILKSLYSNSDPKGPYESILFYENQLKSNNLEKQYGLSYLESTIQWIPTSIWSKRPEDLSVKFAKKTINNYSKGVGLGFSPISEGILNFGFHGPFFGHLIISSTLIVLLIYFPSFFKKDSSSHVSFLLFFIISILFMNRTHYAIPANFLRILFPLLLINISLRLKINNENIARLSNKP